MKRRKFIKAATIGSACTLAAPILADKAYSMNLRDESKIKITVLRRTLNEDLNKEYANGKAEACNVVQEGKEYICESPWLAPEGFCQWAWADIRTYIHLVNQGVYNPMIVCCTDGLRPVFFKIEKS